MPLPIHSLADLLPDDRNANRGSPRGSSLLEKSLRDCGAGRSVLADRNGKLIAGNKTVAGAKTLGLSGVIVVPSDGTKLVVVQRTDLDLDHDKAARELALLDNRSNELSLDWDPAELQQTAADFDLDLDSLGFSPQELDAILRPSPGGPNDDNSEGNDAKAVPIGELFQVIVECRDEQDQRSVYERLTTEGYPCRLSML